MSSRSDIVLSYFRKNNDFMEISLNSDKENLFSITI